MPTAHGRGAPCQFLTILSDASAKLSFLPVLRVRARAGVKARSRVRARSVVRARVGVRARARVRISSASCRYSASEPCAPG